MNAFCAATIVMLSALAPTLGAQERIPNRPPLPAPADSNDWEALYDHGVEWLNNREHARAEAAFYWSSRLNPRRAEPLYARWVTAWARDINRFSRYLRQDPDKPMPPEMQRIDSLRYRAFLRNPLVFQGLVVAAYQELPGRWREDAWTSAWLSYGSLNFSDALAYSARALSRDHKLFPEVRYLRATIYVATGQLDSAAAELAELVDTLHRREEEQTPTVYESKALLQYAVGRIQVARRDYQAARAAFESALVEDLSFFPAHIALGQLAVERHEPAVALKEFEQAAGAGANDPIARYEYGVALLRAGRTAEGVAELQAAVSLEPYFADSNYWWGEALLTLSDSAGARRAFQTYAARAAANAPQLGAVRQRLTALGVNR
jgi:tetratricopeptide (TPR) repeat protein